jgi:hypothetical protein
VTTVLDRLPTRALVVATALAAVLVVALVWRPWTGRAATAPYDDRGAHGRLTLCDSDGDVVTGGEVDEPIAAFALGTTSPDGYDVPGAVATLFAYQPREGVLPEEFSGTPLTAAATLADPGRPAARVTGESTTLESFTAAFPAGWDGHVQLRLLVGAPGVGTDIASYDTADVRIDGSRWVLVDGGHASCDGAAAAVAPTPS